MKTRSKRPSHSFLQGMDIIINRNIIIEKIQKTRGIVAGIQAVKNKSKKMQIEVVLKQNFIKTFFSLSLLKALFITLSKKFDLKIVYLFFQQP